MTHGAKRYDTEQTLDFILLQQVEYAGDKAMILQQGINTNGYGTQLAYMKFQKKSNGMSEPYQEYQIFFLVHDRLCGQLKFFANGEGRRQVTFASADLQSIQAIQNSIRIPTTV